MGVTIKGKDKELYGANSKQVTALINRLEKLPWYKEIGDEKYDVKEQLDRFMTALEVDTFQKEWLATAEVPEKISQLDLDNSLAWKRLKDIPDEIAVIVEETGRRAILDKIVNDIPELVYHGSFKGAFQRYDDQKTVSFLVGHAMYISVLACSWEIVADQSGWEDNPFLYIIDILEQGHLPLGPQLNTFYLS
ncbi:hypothetical protein [Thalassobacillus sp. CUG 92003]|uniref:hypothetical protein n=1 Tax=Thalassobacillus sp. CUG 92003 TaxID=2736641 RepID=UPI0015E669E3|nr:hypothetical protein [Thalassobacillus sp. CUG 92003]